ncbi:hypothetical protein D3C72_1186610 [compost metagenome]
MDVAWPHTIDPHALACHFLCQANGEGVEGALGSGIVHVFVGRAQACGHRRHVDDGPARPAVPACHALQCVLGAEHGADDVGLHDLEQAEFGHVLDPALLADGACVVDQRGDRAELFVHALEQLDDFILDTGVGAYGDGLGAQGADLAEDVLGGLIVGVVVDADAVALAGGQQRRGGTDAAAGTGDDDDFLHGSANRLEREHRQ